MGRKKKSIDRGHLPDTKYNSVIVTKFVCRMMWQGKKSVNMRIMYDAMDAMQKKANTPALEVFLKALDNAKPLVEVKSRRVGGATYQVPVEVRPDRRTSLALRWVIGYARQRTEKTMQERLAAELIEAANNRGSSVKKREDTHKMADANKAFAHYRW